MMRSIESEQQISEIIQKDALMMRILGAAEKLDLPDWWIGAGFLRNKIWDYLEDNESVPSRDIDLVYFNSEDISQETDWEFDDRMAKEYPFAEWEIRNQARMHYVNKFEPFTSTADGISHWVETATCVAVRLNKERLEYLFCYGTDDLFGLVARPVSYFKQEPLLSEFYGRVEKKRWKQRWPDIQVVIE